MKKRLLALGLVTILAGCGNDEVGDVSLGMFTMKDIKLNTLVDPEVPGVTCHVAKDRSGLQFSGPKRQFNFLPSNW